MLKFSYKHHFLVLTLLILYVYVKLFVIMQSDTIHLTFPKEVVVEFKPILMYSKNYEIENFKVNNNDILLKATSHPY